jgi:hypothetical protein
MSNIAKRKKNRNGRGRTQVAVAMPDDLDLLLSTANALDPVDPQATEIGSLGFISAVVIRCVHSGGTPGLVMNFEQYINHRRVCRISLVATSLKDLPDAVPPRIILPTD